MMDINIINYVLLFIYLGLLSAAFFALILDIQRRREPSYVQQLSHINDIYVNEYFNRQEISKIIPAKDEKINNLKKLREFIRENLKPKNNESEEKARRRSIEKSMIKDNWENIFAYNISRCIQRIGIMVLLGIIPAEYVLANHALTIIEDWGYCKNLADIITRKNCPINKIYSSKDKEIYYHRRHGEWLAYVCTIYLYNNWKDKEGSIWLEKHIGYIGNIKTIQKHEKQNRESESYLIPWGVKKKIKKLLKDC